MNKFSEQLLQAFEVAMDEKISTLQYDKTILATIESIENADTGEYKVKYKEGVISAFAYDPLESFKEGDSVYVTVPEGDFNNKKFISHKLSNNTLSTGQYKDLSETIIEVSPDASSLGFTYGGQNVPQTSPTYWGLVAGHNNTSIDSITIMGTSTFSNSFQTYLNNYEYLRIKAEFMTSLDKSHIKGSYGVSLIFLDTENKQVPYFLTFSDFIGDPYHLGSWTPQSVVVKLPKGTLTKVQQISFWEKDFDDNVGEANQINLFMRNLSISFVEKVDMTQNPYFLSIVAQEGTVFPSTGGVIHLAGRIINYGNEINPQNCIYQWFQRDLSVVSGSEDYDKRVGYGWKAIDGATDKDLAVSGSSVIGEQQFKLLAVFNSTIVLTQQVILTHTSLQVSIEQEAVNDTLKLKLVKLNASDAKTYVGDWYYLDTSGNYVKINGTTKVNQTPDISSYLYYSPMTFYCSVYVGNTYQGELTHVMRNMESIDDVSVVFTGESYFSYDANGDINIYDAELERTLTPQIVFNNGIISSSTTIEWLDFDGNVISGSYEWPNQSMITSVWVDTTTNILHYKIKHKFADYPSKNNSFKIRITTIDGQVYTFDKEIVCIKTGDPGTNGTKYQSLIKITSQNKFVGVNSSNTTVTLNCDVYRDSELLTSGSAGVTIEFKWVYTNLIGNTDSGPTVIVRANNSTRTRLAKATITITDNGKTTVLYDFFPVNSCASQPSIDLSELPKYIQYASNGRNPQFRKQVPVIKYNNTQATIATADTTTIKISNGYFKPIDEFDPSKPIGLLTVTVSGITIYHPVPMYINTFGNEAINGWDGVELDLGKDGRHIFAPSVGAGKKNDVNEFTGVVMGIDDQQKPSATSSESKAFTGLFGYKDGTNTFALREDGQAFFGAVGDGRIWLNGTNATIEGGGGGSSSTGNGMTITLAAKNATDDAIRVGNGNFVVTYGGIMAAKGATIDGHLYALDGKIGSTSKTSSDGWSITTNRLYSGSGTSHVELNSDTSSDSNYAIWAGTNTPNGSSEKFSVKRNGTVFMRDAIIKGTLHAKSGYIGCTYNSTTGAYSNDGWQITQKKLYGSAVFTENNQNITRYVVLSTQGQYAMYAGTNSAPADSDTQAQEATKATGSAFWVKFNGDMKATSANIEGTVKAKDGQIGGSSGWTIGTNKIYSNNVCLYSGTENEYKYGASDYYRIWAGAANNAPAKAKFYVTNAGTVRMVDAFSYGTIYAKGGTIGCTYTVNNTTGEITPSGGWSITDNKIYANIANKQKITVGAVYYTNNGLTNNAATVDQDTFVEVTVNNTSYKAFKFSDVNNNTTYYTAPTNIVAADTPGAALSSSGKYAIWAGHQTASSAPFSVTHAGGLKATSANISGKITADSGTIGGKNGWTIETYLLYSGNVCLYSGTGYTRATSEYYRIWAGSGKSSPSTADFSVTDKGYLTAKKGSIGGWTIDSGKLYSDSGNRGISSSGIAAYKEGTSLNTSYVIWSGGTYHAKSGSTPEYIDFPANSDSYFGVTTSGKMYCKAAIINGNIDATGGSIGGWSITSRKRGNNTYSTLKAGDTYLDSDGYISCSEGSFSGSITTGDLDATGGTIGGWTIDGTTLSGGGVTLDSSDGSITGASIYSGKIWNSNKTSYIQCSTYTGGGSMKIVIYPGTANENFLELSCGINGGTLSQGLSLGSATIYGETHSPQQGKDYLLKSSSGFEFNGPVVLDSNSYGSSSPGSKTWQLGPFYGQIYFKIS